MSETNAIVAFLVLAIVGAVITSLAWWLLGDPDDAEVFDCEREV